MASQENSRATARDTSYKDCHASRMVILLACSRRSFSILEDPAVWQMRFAVVLMTLAQIGIWNWNYRAEELGLPPHVQGLLKSVAESN